MLIEIFMFMFDEFSYQIYQNLKRLSAIDLLGASLKEHCKLMSMGIDLAYFHDNNLALQIHCRQIIFFGMSLNRSLSLWTEISFSPPSFSRVEANPDSQMHNLLSMPLSTINYTCHMPLIIIDSID